MFGFTDEAAILIGSLTGAAALGEGGGLRMSIDPDRGSLRMGLAAGPQPADVVLVRHGVRVFLDRAAAPRLHAQVLHAQLGDSRPAFFLRDP